jgi:hypothetical protein
LATLGKVTDGGIKWSHKIVDGTFLQVKFDKTNYQMVLEKVKEKALKPGFRVQLSDAQGCEISFLELPDLAVRMKYPINATPGQAIANEISITIENQGTVEAKDVIVEVVISSDAQIPIQPAAYSENFKEDSLLEGGQGTVASVKPGESLTVSLPGTLKIPADTSPARYYLGAIADPGKKIAELNEENNRETGFIMISIPETQAAGGRPAGKAGWSINPRAIPLKSPARTHPSRMARIGESVQFDLISINSNSATWENFFWEVDTLDRSVWRITGIKFCQKGGTAKEIKMNVQVKGGSKTTPPINFGLGFPGAFNWNMNPLPGNSRFQLLETKSSMPPCGEFLKSKPTSINSNTSSGRIFTGKSMHLKKNCAR